jgi:hypothetical protein
MSILIKFVNQPIVAFVLGYALATLMFFTTGATV